MIKVVDVTGENKKEKSDLIKIIEFLNESFEINKKSSLVSFVDRVPFIEIVKEKEETRISFKGHGRRPVPEKVKRKEVIAKYNHLEINQITVYYRDYIKNAKRFGIKMEQYFGFKDFVVKTDYSKSKK